MNPFSIIIPVVGDVNLFDDTLASVLRYQPEGSQIVVVHNSNYDDPHQLSAEGVELVAVESSSNLIRYFNAGAKRATGEFVAFIRPGIELSENWHVAVTNAFKDDLVGSVSPVIVSSDRADQAVAMGVARGGGFKRKLVGAGAPVNSNPNVEVLSPTSWAGFYRHDLLTALFSEIGSLDESLDSVYLDLELGLCFSTLGFECELAPECVVTIESGKSVTSEFKIPHGMSAQRSYCRHVLHIGTTASQVQSTLVKLTEVASSPFGLWQLKHAGQRSMASRYRDRDEVFSDDLSVAARKLRRQEPSRLKIFCPAAEKSKQRDLEEFEAEQFEAAQRSATNLASSKRKRAMGKTATGKSKRAA